MKRERFDRLLLESKSATREAHQGCPHQEERSGDTTLKWYPVVWKDASRPYSLEVMAPGTLGLVDVTDSVVLRMVEVRGQLEAWARNESDWPMARKEIP